MDYLAYSLSASGSSSQKERMPVCPAKNEVTSNSQSYCLQALNPPPPMSMVLLYLSLVQSQFFD